MFFVIFCILYIYDKKDGKKCFCKKKTILTSKWRAEHPFTGRNTQQRTKSTVGSFPISLWSCYVRHSTRSLEGWGDYSGSSLKVKLGWLVQW